MSESLFIYYNKVSKPIYNMHVVNVASFFIYLKNLHISIYFVRVQNKNIPKSIMNILAYPT